MENRFDAYRSRNAWQLFGAVLLLAQQSAGSIVSTVWLLAGPVLLVSSLAFGWFFEPFADVETTEEMMRALSEAAGRPAYFMVMLTALLAQFVLFATVAIWAVLYVELDEAPRLSVFSDRFWQEAGLLAGTALAVFLLFLALTSLLLLPGVGVPFLFLAVVYYGVTLSPVGAVRLWERSGLLRSVVRCRVLLRSGFGATLGLLALAMLLYLAGVAILGVLLSASNVLFAVPGPWSNLVGAVFSTLGSLWFSLVLLAANLNYFNLLARERARAGGTIVPSGLDIDRSE